MGIIGVRCSRKAVVSSGSSTLHRPVGCCNTPQAAANCVSGIILYQATGKINPFGKNVHDGDLVGPGEQLARDGFRAAPFILSLDNDFLRV